MFVKRVIVENFRLLKNFSIDLQQELSLVIGKNNVGKTSLLVVLDKFINGGTEISYNDFNLDLQKTLENMLTDGSPVSEVVYSEIAIRLRMICKYDENDDLSNIGNTILMDLDEENCFFILGFDYSLSYSNYVDLINDYQEKLSLHSQKQEDKEVPEAFDKHAYLSESYRTFFKLTRKSIAADKVDGTPIESEFIDISKIQGFHLDDVIAFKYIGARRNVDNADLGNTLSAQSSEIYKTQEENDEGVEAKEEFIEHLKETDAKLTTIYGKIFKDIIDKVSTLGGFVKKESLIKVVSTLQHRELLRGNTTVVYSHDDTDLPETYNGLGYMNLISILFEIDIIVRKLKRTKHHAPADINLLFIEEPEAHTHPQMQYIFIKNIKSLLHDGIISNGVHRSLQYIVSTHSAHIVADSDFDDIKYLRKEEGVNAVVAKNISELSKLYENKNGYLKFLKQYLTINRSELFFADKAIFVEGDTERILMPAMMRKLDEEVPVNKDQDEIALLSQNVSLIEVGAHAEIFEPFFNFIGLKKLLVVTDIDMCNAAGRHSKEKYISGTGQITSNTAIKHYMKNTDIDQLVLKTANDKKFRWDNTANEIVQDADGNIMLCYQVKENAYQPRSFEDAFYAANEAFMCSKEFSESAIKEDAVEAFKRDKKPYELAEHVNSKASMAFEIIMQSDSDETHTFLGWDIPTYIKEGLIWLRK